MLSQDPAVVAPDQSAPELALEQSQEVKAKVEACAEEISASNATVQAKIAEGATTLSAPSALAVGRNVQGRIQEVADDLHTVSETLTKGIEELKQLEADLSESRIALAESNAALATATEAEKEARQLALHDSTTGLPNRTLFDARLDQAISMAKRHCWTLAVMFLDLDGFKTINDTHGHAAGDAVLNEVANRLSSHARAEDTVCRNGGDEFLYLLVNPGNLQSIEHIVRSVRQRISQPMAVGNLRLGVDASVGIAVYTSNSHSAEELICLADSAMYKAKKGRTGHAFDTAVGHETAVA